MKTYEFFDHGKFIGRFDLMNDDEAESKAAELASALSMAAIRPKIIYKEMHHGKEED